VKQKKEKKRAPGLPSFFSRLITTVQTLQWPALVEVSELRELPSMLVERYHSVGEVTTLCGIFPDIHRAWASVDSSLFIWRYDKW
jgi:Nup133 N terminal like